MSDAIFKALSDATRQKILQVILRAELTVSELVDVLRIPQSTVSRHLRTLREAGLVQPRSDRTATLYSPVRPENGQAADLPAFVLGWMEQQALPSAIGSRLGRVLQHRRSESAGFFARVAHRWDQLRMDAFGGSFHLEALTTLLPAEWAVADVGTGTGYLLPVLSKAFSRVIAIDPVEEMLAAARQRVELAELSNVDLRPGSVTGLPMADAEVDLCIASLVLHHEPSPPEALAELARVTRAGGRVLIIEQRAHQLAAFHELMQDRWWGFEPQELAKQLRSAGFDSTRYQPLQTAESRKGKSIEAPELFVLTGSRTAA